MQVWWDRSSAQDWCSENWAGCNLEHSQWYQVDRGLLQLFGSCPWGSSILAIGMGVQHYQNYMLYHTQQTFVLISCFAKRNLGDIRVVFPRKSTAHFASIKFSEAGIHVKELSLWGINANIARFFPYLFWNVHWEGESQHGSGLHLTVWHMRWVDKTIISSKSLGEVEKSMILVVKEDHPAVCTAVQCYLCLKKSHNKEYFSSFMNAKMNAALILTPPKYWSCDRSGGSYVRQASGLSV